MNCITLPKTQHDVMLQALREVDQCPKQNYEIVDFHSEGKIDKTKFIGFIPQVTRETFTLLCKECGSLFKLVIDYSVTKENEDYEVISCEAS